MAPDSRNAGDRPWWKGAVLYQIYPRSFQDSNGDGIGDLPGITARLEHVARLGVDAIWISPFFPSPMRDFGYDIADYCGVDPIFGTLADFDALVARAHELGIKVTIDQVYAHSSDLHPWFAQSRQDRDNDKADWFVWADPRADGTPPNNWQSVFGGPAWTWDARRGQYYMHNFLKEQPQINLHNGKVQAAVLDIVRFWLDRGVDGFRIDAINHSMPDPQLRDNPPAPQDGRVRTRPYDFQIKRYSQSHPDIPLFLEKVRSVFDEYPDRFTVAEVGGDDSDAEMKAFTQGDHRLNTAYGFDFLYAPKLTAPFLKAALSRWPAEQGIGWPSWAFENHDAPRAVSRWAGDIDAHAYCRMKMLLLACLRGNIFLYYGEELGLPQGEVAFEDLQDPEAIANWPHTLGRDGARTPMPWSANAPQAGFSNANRTWLKLDPVHTGFAVDSQASDPASTLGYTRQLLRLRRTHPALVHGDIALIDSPEDILAFLRRDESGAVLCVFNLGEAPVRWSPPAELGSLSVIATQNTVDTAAALSHDLAPGTGYWAVVTGS